MKVVGCAKLESRLVFLLPEPLPAGRVICFVFCRPTRRQSLSIPAYPSVPVYRFADRTGWARQELRYLFVFFFLQGLDSHRDDASSVKFLEFQHARGIGRGGRSSKEYLVVGEAGARRRGVRRRD